MNFYDQICVLAAERWSDLQRYIAGEMDREACIGHAVNSLMEYLTTEIDSGRLDPADEAECRNLAEIVLDGHGFTVAEILETTTVAAALPVSVAYSHDLVDALHAGGCQTPGDYTTLSMPGGYGDCLILHSQKAFGIWDALPKTHPDKCANGYGAGSGMYIRD